MLRIDGSAGEGGGQILRTALGLSLVTGAPFTIERIRAGRQRPGLLRQHLTAVEAATRVGRAEVAGATIGSTALTFAPRGIVPGAHAFSVGSAGSATLVLQTVLPALLVADGPSTLELEGGTHNPWAPPFEFLAHAFLPLVNRMGAKVTADLERRGFYPAGGGKLMIAIEPARSLSAFELSHRGAVRSTTACAIVSALPRGIAWRELRIVADRLQLAQHALESVTEESPRGPGNVVMIRVESDHVTELFTGFGERGVRAEAVAEKVAAEARRYLDAGVPVGEYLADQLLVPLALAGEGSFVTLPLSGHATTNLTIIGLFFEREITVAPAGRSAVRVALTRR